MDENSNGSGKTITVIVVIVVVLGLFAGGWYWFMYKPEQIAKEKARQEQIAKEAARKKQEEEAARKKIKYDQLIETADQQYNQEEWESAKSTYTEASSLLPKQQYPQDQLELINQKLEEIAAKEPRRAAGVVETISTSTGRFYLVVSSSIDGDLAMDYGSKLAKSGENIKLIEPYGKNRFYRVSIGDYDTNDQAVSASSSISETYGEGVWVLRY